MDIEKFVEQAHEIFYLTPDEKKKTKSDLEHFMQTHPLDGVARSFVREEKPGLFSLLSRMHFFPGIAAVLLLVLGVGGGVGYAAENALPGEIFYPLKVFVTEEIAEQLNNDSPEEEAEFRTRRAIRRMMEIEHMASENDWNEKNITAAEEYLDLHVEEARMAFKRLEDSGAAQNALSLTERMESSLRSVRTAVEPRIAEGTTARSVLDAIVRKASEVSVSKRALQRLLDDRVIEVQAAEEGIPSGSVPAVLDAASQSSEPAEEISSASQSSLAGKPSSSSEGRSSLSTSAAQSSVQSSGSSEQDLQESSHSSFEAASSSKKDILEELPVELPVDLPPVQIDVDVPVLPSL